MNTEGRVYVLVHAFVPRAIVIAEPVKELHGLDWTAIKEHIPVYGPHSWPREYDRLHPWLHKVLGNECRNRGHMKIMRNGKYSRFGGLVRLGYPGSLKREAETGRPIVLGCADTPCMDVDAVRVEGDRVVGLVELKKRGERLTPFQRSVLKNMRKAGVRYVEERH